MVNHRINYSSMVQLNKNLLNQLRMMLQLSLMLKFLTAQPMLMSSKMRLSKWAVKLINLKDLLTLHSPRLQQLLLKL